jgi:hypothetical protein
MPLEDNESFKRELKTWLFRKAYGEKRFNSMGSGKCFISVTYYYYYYGSIQTIKSKVLEMRFNVAKNLN